MPDPFKIEFQARPRPFPVPKRVEVEVDGLETKWLPLAAVPRETLAALVEEWRAKVMGETAPAAASDHDLIRVGEEGDPIRVEFRREGSRWVYRCLHTDEALRGKFLYDRMSVDFIDVMSADHPDIGYVGVYLRGHLRDRDDDAIAVLHHSPHALAAAVREAMPAARRMVEEAKR